MRHGGSGGAKTKSARTAAICAAALVTLCVLSPSAKATDVPPGRIVSLIPSDDEVSQFVGLPVTQTGAPAVRPRPQDHLEERDECRTLLFNNTDDVWQSDYTAFRSQVWTYRPDQDRMYVSQTVATFTNTSSARDRFDAVYNPNLFTTCSHALLHGPLMAPGVAYELFDFQLKDDVVLWTASVKDYGRYTGFNAVFAAWHLGNVMAISGVGQQGNPAQAAARLTGYLLDRVG